VLGIPTIGCAKSILVGEYDELADEPGSHAELTDPHTKELLGYVLRTKCGVKPVFVSPGHLITHGEALDLVKKCILRHRIPEPTRAAHTLVNEYRKKSLPTKL
jgi:deoxyribonuclease V